MGRLENAGSKNLGLGLSTSSGLVAFLSVNRRLRITLLASYRSLGSIDTLHSKVTRRLPQEIFISLICRKTATSRVFGGTRKDNPEVELVANQEIMKTNIDSEEGSGSFLTTFVEKWVEAQPEEVFSRENQEP